MDDAAEIRTGPFRESKMDPTGEHLDAMYSNISHKIHKEAETQHQESIKQEEEDIIFWLRGWRSDAWL